MKIQVLSLWGSAFLALFAMPACTASQAKASKPEAALTTPAPEPEKETAVTTTSAPKPTLVSSLNEQPPVTDVSKASVETKTPTQIIEKYTEELKGVVEIKDPTKKGAKDAKRENTIAEKVRKLFDFNELAMQSLGKNNIKKFTPQKKKDFSKLFTTLVEKNYLERSRNLMGEYKVVIQNEKIEGNKARVTSKILRSDSNKTDVDLSIVYELHKKNSDWMIYNIIFDEVNLANNYQSQFNKVIASGGPDKLINLMKDKIKQSDKNDLKI